MSYSSLSLEENISLQKPEKMTGLLKEIPYHVGIVMDGNRRWASQRGEMAYYGHLKGADNVESIVEAAKDLGIKVLTLYGFSTENWRRSKEEVETLMQLITLYLRKLEKLMIKKGIRFHAIGELASLPKGVQEQIEETTRLTMQGSDLELILAISYGGRDDIRRASIKACQNLLSEGRSLSELTEQMMSKVMDTHFVEDPDLIIRTGGMSRLSNFLLWQSAYSELYITSTLWPDFSKEDLAMALQDYQNREKNWGK